MKTTQLRIICIYECTYHTYVCMDQLAEAIKYIVSVEARLLVSISDPCTSVHLQCSLGGLVGCSAVFSGDFHHTPLHHHRLLFCLSLSSNMGREKKKVCQS